MIVLTASDCLQAVVLLATSSDRYQIDAVKAAREEKFAAQFMVYSRMLCPAMFTHGALGVEVYQMNEAVIIQTAVQAFFCLLCLIRVQIHSTADLS